MPFLKFQKIKKIPPLIIYKKIMEERKSIIIAKYIKNKRNLILKFINSLQLFLKKKMKKLIELLFK